MDASRRATLAVQRCGTQHAPADRVAVYDHRVESTSHTLTGVVSTDRLRERALDAASVVVDEPISCDVTQTATASALRNSGTELTQPPSTRRTAGNESAFQTATSAGCGTTRSVNRARSTLTANGY